MECHIVRKKFSSYLDGELQHAEASAVRDHLADCGPCAEEYRSLSSTWALIGEIPQVEPRTDLWPQVEKRLRAQSAPKTSLWNLLHSRPFAALASLMLLIGLYLGHSVGKLALGQIGEVPTAGESLQEPQDTGGVPYFGDIPPGSLAEGFLETTLASNGPRPKGLKQ